MKITLFKELDVYENIYQKDNNNREINVYKLNNIIPQGHNLFYPNVLLKDEEKLILPILEKTMSLKMGTIYEKNNMQFDISNLKINLIYKEPLFFFIYNTDNYFHFLYDTIPYLITYFKLKNTKHNIKLLMQYPNPQKKEIYLFVTELLEILNIKKDDIVLIDENTMYSEVYISTSYTHDIDSNIPPRQEIYDFYQNISKTTQDKYKLDTPTKIYISRRSWLHNDFSNIGTNYTTRRKMINEDEYVDKLIKEGYQEVFTEKLSMIEKILYFSNCTHVKGAIGGGISNVLFSKKNTKLEALISPTFLDVNKRFKFSLECVDVTYNKNTIHVENDKFKTYMRVKTKDNKIIGEIEKIYKDELIISYNDGSNMGWNLENSYNQITLNKDDVIKLDEGLNSHLKLILDI